MNKQVFSEEAGQASSAQRVPELFELSGKLNCGGIPREVKMTGRPLEPEELWLVLDLERPGLEKVKAAVDMNNFSAAAKALLAYYRQRQSPGWMTGPSIHAQDKPDKIQKVISRSSELPKLTASDEDMNIAADAENHIFAALVYPSHNYGEDINWDANPVRDIEWPCQMHRFGCWADEITRCYSATGDERWARVWVDLTSDWIRKNPITVKDLDFGRSWNTIQNGIRLQYMAGYFPYYLHSEACTPEFLTLMLTSIYNHARRVEQLPIDNYLGANFAGIEVGGLAYAAAVFPEYHDAALWRTIVLKRMNDIMDKQFMQDGVHVELSPNYNLHMAEYCLDLLELFGSNAIPAKQVAMIDSIAEVFLAISKQNHYLLNVGDTGRNIDTHPFLVRAARVLERPDLLAVATDGREGKLPLKRNYAFKDGGFYSFRSGWDADAVWMGLACGPNPYKGYHSQFDRGTFELMAFGRELMIDPGVFGYQAGGKRREDFRRTAAHQCLTKNSENAQQQGRCLQWEEDDGKGNAILTVENASYKDLNFRRTVFFVARKYFVLIDEALGTAEGNMDLHFQLVPGPSIIDPATKTARTNFEDGGNVLVWTDPDAPVELEPEVAWFSPKWTVTEPLPAFRYRALSKKAPIRFVTVLAPYQDKLIPSITQCSVSGEIGGKLLKVELKIDGSSWDMERHIR